MFSWDILNLKNMSWKITWTERVGIRNHENALILYQNFILVTGCGVGRKEQNNSFGSKVDLSSSGCWAFFSLTTTVSTWDFQCHPSRGREKWKIWEMSHLLSDHVHRLQRTQWSLSLLESCRVESSCMRRRWEYLEWAQDTSVVYFTIKPRHTIYRIDIITENLEGRAIIYCQIVC